LDFLTDPVSVLPRECHNDPAVAEAQSKLCTIMGISDPAIDVVGDCTVPQFGKPPSFEFPKLIPTSLKPWCTSIRLYSEISQEAPLLLSTTSLHLELL